MNRNPESKIPNPTQIINHESQIPNPSAFTPIELLVVISIIALLVGILLPTLRRVRNRLSILSLNYWGALARAPPALTHSVLSGAEGFCRPRRVAENKPTTERIEVMRTRKSTSVRGITTLGACTLASAAPGSAKNNKRIIAPGGAFRIFRMAGLSRGFVLGLLLMLWASLGMPPAALGQNGRIDWGQIFSDALTNNLMGDSANRWFAVYLPPSYDSTQKRYPVVYALHGYGGSPCGMVLELQSTLDSMTANRMIGEMIVVFPDGNNRLFGSQYLSSPVIGDYETYIAKDLVAYIDAHYRTLATRNSRGITGGSMGGWGSMHLALKFPDVFSVVVPNAGYYDAVGDVAVWIFQNFAPYHPTNLVEFDRLDFPWNWAQSLLAGMLPNLQRPPMYTDYPYELIDGQVVAVEAALQRLRDGDVLHGDLGRYTKLPVQLNAIKIVHGTNDTTAPISMAREFTNALAAAGVQFAYEEHEGGHMYVPELSLPFLSDNLEGARAGTLRVTTLNDSGPGSLRQTIADASPGDTITFDVKGTITLTSGALTIDKNLDVEGPGPDKLKISGNHASRVFVIASGTVTLAGMTIAEGRADANSPISPCGGGGILVGGKPVNLGPASLTLSNAVVSDNQALGDPSKSALGSPGGAAGGGVANFGTLAVTASSFIGNLARGGDGSSSSDPFAGIGIGGAIFNWGGSPTVTGSTFSWNRAVGGSNCLGPALSGMSEGGAISSIGTLAVSDSEFYHNQAIGGNGNRATLPVPAERGPGRATAGAIDVHNGPATIDGCTLEHNEALGGAGGSGGDGGLASGGAIRLLAFQSPTAQVTVSNCKVEHNTARGGPGGPGGNGGDGWGGGLSSLYAGSTLTVIGTTVDLNDARGGEGGTGGNGGNGLGGGLYNSASSTLTLEGATVSFNLALGGSGGQGIGGGVYNNGTYSADPTTVMEKNNATTSNDNIWP